MSPKFTLRYSETALFQQKPSIINGEPLLCYKCKLCEPVYVGSFYENWMARTYMVCRPCLNTMDIEDPNIYITIGDDKCVYEIFADCDDVYEILNMYDGDARDRAAAEFESQTCKSKI